MKIIGITGGVGSGKSEILNILKNDYQAKVIQSDQFLIKSLHLHFYE